MRAPGPCAECGARGAARYRCPRCGSAYCSVPCCRTHRERCAPDSPRERAAAGHGPSPGPAHGPWSVEDILGEEDEQDRVPLQKLKLLGESEELRGLLLNPHLRRLLLTIDQAQDRSSLMRRFMQEPLFVEFADCCLRIVEPPEKENVLPE
ncbi:zinc finger HIT domain-containing protein 3 [Corvus moneduloides]|uniref:zinc finger HIT domain-containing protein 3 n=1 Tax=Corvus moneduloides TaxID=1196302 RepID=UPI0013641CDF|nr:zinc finger HIT domain-containing protein 3 [Corvus moneduloides]